MNMAHASTSRTYNQSHWSNFEYAMRFWSITDHTSVASAAIVAKHSTFTFSYVLSALSPTIVIGRLRCRMWAPTQGAILCHRPSYIATSFESAQNRPNVAEREVERGNRYRAR